MLSEPKLVDAGFMLGSISFFQLNFGLLDFSKKSEACWTGRISNALPGIEVLDNSDPISLL